MVDISKLSFGWEDVAKFGVMLAGVAGIWFTTSGDVREAKTELLRIKTETLPVFTQADREQTASLLKLREDMNSMRLASTEILTELRTDLRHLRVVLERLERSQFGSAPPGPRP